MIKPILKLASPLLLTLLALLPCLANAFDDIDDSVIFPNVAQAHHGDNNSSNCKPNSMLTMNGQSRINGTEGNDLNFCSSNDGNGLPDTSCDTASGGDRKCTVAGADIRGLKLTGTNKFKDSNGTVDGFGWCSDGQGLSLGGDSDPHFKSISLYSACTLTMSASHSEYFFDSVALGSGAAMVLPAGDYWFESLALNGDSHIVLLGDVRMFLKSSTQFNSAKVNAGGKHKLTIIAYDQLQLNGDTQISGDVFAQESLIMYGSSFIDGKVTAANLTMGDSSAIGVNPSIPAQCVTGQDNLEGLTYRTYDSRPWSSSNNSPASHDQFETLISQVKKTTYQIGESIEGNIDQKGDGINPHSNDAAAQDLYLGVFEGFIDAPETGMYTFAVDGDDAIELLIDGQVITGFYNAHATCNCTTYQGTALLEQGTHTIELRFHEAFGYESFKLYWQTPSANELTIVPASSLLTCPAPQFEFGRVTLDSSGNANIAFDNSYALAPLVMVMPTIDGSNADGDGPSTVRVVSRTAAAASISQQSPPGNRITAKAMEEVDYFVMEQGYRFLETGKALQAGLVSTSQYQGKNASGPNIGDSNIIFGHAFGSAPAILGQTLTWNNGDFVTTFIRDVTETNFNLGIEASEINLTIDNDELLGYVAGLGQGSMAIDGKNIKYEFANGLNSNQGNRTLNQQCNYNNSYLQTYTAQPITIANKNKRAGVDGGWIRRCTTTDFTNQVSFALDEDQQGDAERRHTIESVGYFAFEYTEAPPAANHYRISFSANGLTCAPKAITIEACADDECSSTLTDPVSVVLTKDNVDYQSITFTDSTTTDLWHTSVGTINIGLTATAPIAPYYCYIDGVSVSNEGCNLTFANSGIYFDIDNTTACKDSAVFDLYAVETDPITQACKPVFANEQHQIDMDFEYISPSKTAINEEAKLTVSSQLGTPNSVVLESGLVGQGLLAEFNSEGRAKLKINYPEAGKIQFDARVVIDPDDGSGQTKWLTHSDQFVSAPDGFHFFNASGNDGCTTADCARLAKAGDDFTMNVKAVCGVSDNSDFKDRAALKNFQLSDLKIKAELKAPLAINPNDSVDGVLGSIGANLIEFTKSNSAPFTLNTQTYSEVGAISFALDGDINYQGVTIDESQSSSEIFGRFTPFYLSIEGNEPALSAACNTFTYMDQPFGFAVGSEPTIQVVGKNKNDAVTNNYQIDNWWRYSGLNWADRVYSDTSLATSEDGAALQVSDTSPKSGAVNFYPVDSANTVQRAYLSGAQLQYNRTSSLARPFNAQFDLDLSVADVTDADSICYRSSAAGSCIGFTFEDIAQDDTFELRYGRLEMQNAYGPSSEELRLELGTQYVDASGQWVTNTADSCSVFNTTSATSTADVGLVLTPQTGLENVAGYTSPGGSGTAGVIGLGNSFIYFPAPNVEGEVALQQHVDKWLQWYWNFDANTGVLQDPRATAYFGTYRGHDRIIYWREVN
ncbi:DUF6701 domain-containing protein [Shewanella youngdeokensis]|uniref:DUF6701 domain-containing protein n=1 Tax=Shewanella youngdeokensis TaxID=2999068 RepID=A0ABZ0JYV3_9GAMM|nr:DUF6701 domain-containing protein [Shewanella sp. DAU334]